MANYDEEMTVSQSGEKTERARKNILLLGDSIRQGYCAYAKAALSEVADVRYPNENCRFTQHTLTSLPNYVRLFENCADIDCVLFNNGHWDIAHWGGEEVSLNPIPVYTAMLGRIAAKLRKLAPNAKLYFATTSPSNPNGTLGLNPRTNAEIEAYNAAAKELMRSLNIPVCDHYGFLQPYSADYYRDYCHLTEQGFRLLGEYTAQWLRKEMEF